MTTRQEDRLSFNLMISRALRASTKTQIFYEKDLSSIKDFIFYQMFGGYTLIRKDGTDLIKTIEDASTGGLRAINLDKKQLEIICQQIEGFGDDPNLKLTIWEIMDEIIATIKTHQASTKLFIKKKLDDEKKFALYLEHSLYSIKPIGTKQIIKNIKDLLNEIHQKQKDGLFKTINDYTNTIQKMVGAGTLVQMFAFAATYKTVKDRFGKIPALLGPVPLKHVNYIEIARSGKILKFRATGSVYLAGQHGGDQMDAIKIEGILYKAEFGFMFLLWALFLYGQSKFKDLEKLVKGEAKIGTIAELTKLRKMNDLITTDTSLQRPSYEFHRTFPFVNRHFIIPNCYIETILLEDKLPFKDTIRYSILLRTYEKPIEAIRFVKSKDKNISMFGFTKKSFLADVCQYSLSAAWRLFNAYGWMADELEWKIGSASKPGVLDTYYDIDPSAICTVAYLSLMGAVV